MILKALLSIQMICKCLQKYWRIQCDKERKILIVSDDMIADTINNKKLNSIKTENLLEARN